MTLCLSFPPHPPIISCGIFYHSLSRAWRNGEKGIYRGIFYTRVLAYRLEHAHFSFFTRKLLILYIKLCAPYPQKCAPYPQKCACYAFFCASSIFASTPYIYTYLFEKKENKRESIGVYKAFLIARVKYISKYLMRVFDLRARVIPRSFFKVNALLIQSLNFAPRCMRAFRLAYMPPTARVCELKGFVHVDFGWCL